MKNPRKTGIFLPPLVSLLAVFFLMSFPVQPASAQTFIEPSTPLGGPTAAPLNSSATTQRKLGSLIVGTQGGSSKLCLNSNGSAADLTNPVYCVASWTDLGSLVGGYVVVRTNNYTGSTPPDPAAQTGYVRIKANAANNQLYTIIAEASSLTNAAAVYAYDSGNGNAWAAYFNGRVYVGDGTVASAKQLCLNSASPFLTCVGGSTPGATCGIGFPACGGAGVCTAAASGKGCIAGWGDVSSTVGNTYVKLQSVPGPLNVQVGGEALTGAGIFGLDPAPAVPAKTGGTVLGTPWPTTNYCLTCGDGICESNTTPAETVGNCPASGAPAGCPNVPRGDC